MVFLTRQKYEQLLIDSFDSVNPDNVGLYLRVPERVIKKEQQTKKLSEAIITFVTNEGEELAEDSLKKLVRNVGDFFKKGQNKEACFRLPIKSGPSAKKRKHDSSGLNDSFLEMYSLMGTDEPECGKSGVTAQCEMFQQLQEKIDQLEAENSNLRSEIKQISGDKAVLEDKNKKLATRNAHLEQEMTSMKKLFCRAKTQTGGHGKISPKWIPQLLCIKANLARISNGECQKKCGIWDLGAYNRCKDVRHCKNPGARWRGIGLVGTYQM